MDERDYTTKSSLNSAPEKRAVPDVAPVAKASVEKKSFGRRLKDYLIAGTAQDLKGFLINDILVPHIKDTISESVSRGIDMLLYNDAKPRSTSVKQASRSGFGTAYVSYNNPSRSTRTRYIESDGGETTMEAGYLTWETRRKAEDIKNKMLDILEEYEVVPLATFYQLADWKTEPNDFEFGWYNLSTIEVVRTRTGRYRIELPKPVSLK